MLAHHLNNRRSCRTHRSAGTGNFPQRVPLRRGKSLLAREEDVPESGLALFKRGPTLRKIQSKATLPSLESPETRQSRGCLGDIPGPKDAWMVYCFVLTVCVPSFMLKSCGAYATHVDRAVLMARFRQAYGRQNSNVRGERRWDSSASSSS